MTHSEESVLTRALLEMKEDIGEIKTKVDILVGPTGTNGRVGTLEKKVAILEGSRQHQKGRNSVFAGAWAFIGMVAGGLIKWGIEHLWK